MMAILDRIREADWEAEFLVDRRPRVQAYWRALKERPSYAAGIAAHEHPTVVRGTERIVACKRNDPGFAAALVSRAGPARAGPRPPVDPGQLSA